MFIGAYLNIAMRCLFSDNIWFIFVQMHQEHNKISLQLATWEVGLAKSTTNDFTQRVNKRICNSEWLRCVNFMHSV